MDKNLTVTKEIVINAPVSRVWQALVNPDDIQKYLYGTETITDWKAGSPIRFTGEWKGEQYEDKGTILQIEKGKLLQYNYWSGFSGMPDIPENYSIVTFSLEPKGDETILTVSQSHFPTQQAYEHSDSGWETVMGDLKNMLEEEQIRQQAASQKEL